jgi:lipoyl synthase
MAIFRELPVLTQPGHASALGSLATTLPGELARPLSPSRAARVLAARKPEWLKIRPPGGESYLQIKQLLRERGLHTVCEEAHCPNVAECWATGTATFMLGGDVCTRACRFCAVRTARVPPPLDPAEPLHVAESIAALKLRYVVLTSVDRDDLPDGGAGHFAATIREIKRLDPSILVEALVPDFRGDVAAVQAIVESGLDVYAHNIETVRRLQYRVRDPRAGYEQSLGTLRAAREMARARGQRMFTKSALMLGLGEEATELEEAFTDMRVFGVDVLTLGQYLRPSLQHLPVERYVPPEEFDRLGERAREQGFLYVAAGPMVRSSYRAAELFMQGLFESEAASAARHTNEAAAAARHTNEAASAARHT